MIANNIIEHRLSDIAIEFSVVAVILRIIIKSNVVYMMLCLSFAAKQFNSHGIINSRLLNAVIFYNIS